MTLANQVREELLKENPWLRNWNIAYVLDSGPTIKFTLKDPSDTLHVKLEFLRSDRVFFFNSGFYSASEVGKGLSTWAFQTFTDLECAFVSKDLIEEQNNQRDTKKMYAFSTAREIQDELSEYGRKVNLLYHQLSEAANKVKYLGDEIDKL